MPSSDWQAGKELAVHEPPLHVSPQVLGLPSLQLEPSLLGRVHDSGGKVVMISLQPPCALEHS